MAALNGNYGFDRLSPGGQHSIAAPPRIRKLRRIHADDSLRDQICALVHVAPLSLLR